MGRKDENVLCAAGMIASESERAAGAIGMRERMKRRREITGADQVKEMRQAAGITITDVSNDREFNRINKCFNPNRKKRQPTEEERQKQIDDMRKAASKGL